MNDINFFSSNEYLFLPNRTNPKVALAIDSPQLANNAFQLYNPFSSRAKTLKSVAHFFSINFNILVKKMVASKKEKSDFILFLEQELGESLVASLYYATVKDKIVIQLQTIQAEVIGYLKYPLNEVGLKHIKNEINAFEKLSSLGIVKPYILSMEYQNRPFLLLPEIKGKIGMVKREELDKILEQFKKDEAFPLEKHPRVVSLQEELLANNMQSYALIIDKLKAQSKREFRVVYEHGDFTPWNIIEVQGEFEAFDFEYYVEDGLEYFDLIKYYYQIFKLLEQKSEEEIVDAIYKEINIDEIEYLLKLFLIKEVLRDTIEGLECSFEQKVLRVMER